MASPKKSDCAQYEFKLIHEDAKALSAGLTTEVDYFTIIMKFMFKSQLIALPIYAPDGIA